MKFQKAILNKKDIKDFSLERNKILKESKHEWLFFLDSDEVLSKELNLEINKLNSKQKYGSFFIKRKNYFLNQYIGEDKIIRLIKKSSGKWRRLVHEVFISNKPKKMLKNYIIHNTAKDLNRYIDKINKYSTLHSVSNKKEGKRSGIIKIIVYPILKFLVTLIKSKNTVFSITQSFHSFLSWSKQYLNQK